MSANSFGQLFRVTTFGESHGAGLGCVIDGCPSGFAFTESDIQTFLDKRRPGQSKYTSQRREPDTVEIVSGLFEGRTTGAPIMLLIRNQDVRSSDYEAIKAQFRPGHADYTYFHKYAHRDWRGGGRASARETVARVAAGAVAQLYLRQIVGLEIRAYLSQIGSLLLDFKDEHFISENPFFCAEVSKVDAIKDLIDALRKAGDSVGAKVSVVARGVPIGLGEPVFDKLSATLAHAMMSIPAAKGVEIGDGFAVVSQKGSEHRDAISQNGFLSNHTGGILGGISSGQEICVSVAFKPTSSIIKPIQSIDTEGNTAMVVTKGRHDPCVGIRAVPIVEAMMALTLMDHWLLMSAYSNKFN